MTICVACKNGSFDKSSEYSIRSRTVQIKLIDSLGIITLDVPSRYDTSFEWVNRSDCGKPCDEQKYRFQPKNLPILKESGWITTYPKDSIDQFTITHSSYFPFRNYEASKNVDRHNDIKSNLLSDIVNPPIVFDTIQKINNKYFSIFVMEKPDTVHHRKVIAITSINGNEIEFEYELLSRVSDPTGINFISNSLNLISTIRINDKKMK
jgi:hypothetical protein